MSALAACRKRRWDDGIQFWFKFHLWFFVHYFLNDALKFAISNTSEIWNTLINSNSANRQMFWNHVVWIWYKFLELFLAQACLNCFGTSWLELFSSKQIDEFHITIISFTTSPVVSTLIFRVVQLIIVWHQTSVVCINEFAVVFSYEQFLC